MSYVVAFNRDRDFYQVPLALFERGLLDRLITDFYTPDPLSRLPASWCSKIGHRRIDGLPSKVVKSNSKAIWHQLVGLKFLKGRAAPILKRVDDSLSNSALARADKSGADLFLYSHYASRAFASGRSRGRVKGLFMFHPHAGLSQEILVEDCDENPECRWSLENEEVTVPTGERLESLDLEWRLADFIVCASAYTARSLEHAGCDPSKISIVPYGIDAGTIPFEAGTKSQNRCRFLFVGQGVQRKGLHHLFKAWRNLRLFDAHLTVISNRIDPGIAAIVPDGVTILGHQSPESLRRHYEACNVFVLPSLVEGFGLVYLEALASGCYCIGTKNTGLVDLCPPKEVGCILEAGSTSEVERGLLDAYQRFRKGGIDHQLIRDFSCSLPWTSFRKSVAEVAERFSRSDKSVRGIPVEQYLVN